MTQPSATGASTPSASNWLDDVAFTITDEQQVYSDAYKQAGGGPGPIFSTPVDYAPQAPHAAPPPAEGFSLDRDEAKNLLRKARFLRTELKDLLTDATTLSRLSPPAAEPASAEYNNRVTWKDGAPGAFAYGGGHIEVEMAYLSALVKRLHEAIFGYEEADAEAGDDVEKSTEKDGGLLGQ